MCRLGQVNPVKIFTWLFLLSLLSGCGVVVRQLESSWADDQIDYNESRSLPPLEIPAELANNEFSSSPSLPTGRMAKKVEVPPLYKKDSGGDYLFDIPSVSPQSSPPVSSSSKDDSIKSDDVFPHHREWIEVGDEPIL